MSRIWQLGEVVKSDAGRAWVRLSPASSCQRCASGHGCGAGVFSRLFASRKVELALENRIHAMPGQRVLVGISGTALAGAATRLYGAPTLAFVAGAWLTSKFGTAYIPGALMADIAVLVMGLLFAAAVFAYLARRPLGGLEPVMRALVCERVPA